MSTPVPLRSDFDAIGLRMLARRSRDPDQTRRLLALAEIYHGGSKTDRLDAQGLLRLLAALWTHCRSRLTGHAHYRRSGNLLGRASKASGKNPQCRAECGDFL